MAHTIRLMSVEELKEKLLPYKGQFEMSNDYFIRHRTRCYGEGIPCCPMQILVEDLEGRTTSPMLAKFNYGPGATKIARAADSEAWDDEIHDLREFLISLCSNPRTP